MNIALIGYGKMGKAIEDIALERGHTISLKIDKGDVLASLDWSNTDVAIEFTAPEVAVGNIEFCLKNAIPIIVGTTGWYERFD